MMNAFNISTRTVAVLSATNCSWQWQGKSHPVYLNLDRLTNWRWCWWQHLPPVPSSSPQTAPGGALMAMFGLSLPLLCMCFLCTSVSVCMCLHLSHPWSHRSLILSLSRTCRLCSLASASSDRHHQEYHHQHRQSGGALSLQRWPAMIC